MSARLTRRGALGVAGLTLASCGGGDPPPANRGPSLAGVGSLRSQLALEQAAIAAYESAAELIRGDALRVLMAIRDQERTHVEELAAMIRSRGAEPPAGRDPAAYAATFPRLRTREDALRFLEDIEQRQVRRYVGALSMQPDRELRLQAAKLGEAEGGQLAAVRVLAGAPASPNAFETGAL